MFTWREELVILTLGLLGPWAGLVAWLLLVGDIGWQ